MSRLYDKTLDFFRVYDKTPVIVNPRNENLGRMCFHMIETHSMIKMLLYI